MTRFKPGEEVTVSGTVLRERDGRVELQLQDGQLLRVPLAHAARAPKEKAVQQAPENKGVPAAPENKAGRARQSGGNGGGGKNAGDGRKHGV